MVTHPFSNSFAMFFPSPRLLPLLRLRANTDGAIDDDDVQLQALELELLTAPRGESDCSHVF